MADAETAAQHKQGFTARVKAARTARALKQWELADALGMTQDRYKQYETRSYLPPHLIARFCLICRVNPEWLMTGNGKMAPQERQEAASEAPPLQVSKARKKSAA